MRNSIQSLAQAAFWATGFIALVTIPQIVCTAVGAPIAY